MKRKTPLLLALLMLVVLAIGCAPKRMYYWGDYSQTLYHYRKQPSEETLLKHKQVLENIIQKSNKTNRRIPPGVYAELGYIYFRQNNNKQAVEYFHLEEQTYPESKVFMQRLLQAVKLRGEKDDPSSGEEIPTEDDTKTEMSEGG